MDDDLQGVWYRGLFLETERKWKLRELALAHELVEVIEHGRGHVKWMVHDSISKLFEFVVAGLQLAYGQ